MSHDLSTSSISTYMIELWDERFTRGYIYNYVGKGNLAAIMHVLNNPCLSFQLGVKGRNVSGWLVWHCILCSMCVGTCVCGSTMIIGAWSIPSHHMQCLPHIYLHMYMLVSLLPPSQLSLSPTFSSSSLVQSFSESFRTLTSEPAHNYLRNVPTHTDETLQFWNMVERYTALS